MTVEEILRRIRERRPLVHNITNWVVTNAVANALLAVGAAPVMAYAPEEVGAMASQAGALALNMGTPNSDVVAAMQLAGSAANQQGVPVVFDPVGVGATPYRITVARTIVKTVRLAVIRGNQGEIGHLVGVEGRVSGVDSLQVGEGLAEAMTAYAARTGTVVVATGATDLVSDGQRCFVCTNGHPWLAQVTGTGCMLTGLIGAALAVAPGDVPGAWADAAVGAVTLFNVAAEIAAQKAHGPGSFAVALLDALAQVTPEEVGARARIRETGSA